MEKYDINNGHLSFSGVEVLYSHVQKFYIKSIKGEEKSKMLRITMELKSASTISLGKMLSLQVTDDNDCTFFYSLLLSIEDFSVLKNQQGILVDFDHFPSQLIKLLEACRSTEYNKFILVLDEEDSINQNISHKSTKDFVYLKVIETNNFKNLCHLSLKVLQGSDADIKNHLSVKIAHLTDKLAEEEKNGRMLKMNLSEALKSLDAKTKELSEVQMKLTEDKNCLILETSRQISEEREKISKLQMEWQHKLEMEKSQLISQYQKQINDLNEQIGSLTFNNKNLYEAKCHFESGLKERNYQIETLEKQIKQLTQEVALLRKQNTQLDQEYHEKDKMVVGLKTKLAVVEQELKDKEKFLEKQQELLKVANEQKTFLEEALSEKEANLQRKQAAVQTLSADLMKSNEIIAKLQTDLAANKAKMKLRTDIALEQEKILEKKTQQIASQGETIKELEEKVAKLKNEMNSLKTQLEEANNKIEEKELTIKKNDNVINWLNRRLTESTVNPPPPPPSASHLVTTSRAGNDSVFGASQPKGCISNLTKGWPPWLVNSVAGSSQSPVDTIGISNSSNSTSRITMSSTPVDLLQDQSKSKLQTTNENQTTENKDGKHEMKATSGDSKPRGLDPKYFQSCIDKDYTVNPQVLKTCNPKEDWKSSNCKTSSSRPTSGRQPTSAYFPKKPVPL